MQNAEDIVTLVDEEGKAHDFSVVDIIEVEGKEYALLLPAGAGESEEEEEVLVLRLEEDRFEMIEDEAEFAKVVKVLEEMSEEEEG